MKNFLPLVIILIALFVLTACDISRNSDSSTMPGITEDPICTSNPDVYTDIDMDISKLTPSDGLEFALSDDGSFYILYGVGICIDTDIVIPSTYEKLPVKEIANGAFKDYSALTSIIIPDSVSVIPIEAFSGCTRLKQVILGNSVEEIGSYAFYGCSALSSINIPNSIEVVGPDAFAQCSQLNYIESDNCRYLGNKSNPYFILISATEKNLPTYNINSHTKIIYSDAFSDCGNLVTITIPDSVIYIGSSAFYKCQRLSNVELGIGVKHLGAFAFSQCKALQNIILPNTLMGINPYTFSKCENLENVNLGSSIEYISNNAFECCDSLKKIVVPQSVSVINELAFSYCENLSELVVSNSSITLETNAIYDCPIKYATIPVQYISLVTNSKLTEINIIGEGKIPENAFALWGEYGGDNLRHIIISDLVTSIDQKAFTGLPVLSNIEVDENNKYYKSIDGNLYTKDGKTLVRYAVGKTNTDFRIPNHVTNIAPEAFLEAVNLLNIEIPDSVTSIGDKSFEECTSLKSVKIGSGVTQIGDEAFRWCENLINFAYNGTSNDWKKITKGSYWRNCSNYWYIPAECVVCSDGPADFE